MTLRRKKTNQKGYTLVEAMVVLVIIGIIASTAIGGLTMYRRHAAFKKNNEYAQTLFAASQAAMSHAKVSGQLEELREDLKSGEDKSGELKEGMILNGTDFNKRAAEGGLYFLCYKRGMEVEGAAHKLLYDMLAPYVYDDVILDATYCIEFDAVDGTVLGVLYSDWAKDFAYSGGSTTDAKGTVSIADRDRETREEILLGYYGVESLSARAPQTSLKAFIKDLKLVNDETLHAEWSVDSEKSTVAADAMQFELQIYRTNQEGKEEIIAGFTVNDSTKDENKFQKKDGSGYVKCDVWFYDEEGKKADTPITYQFPAYIDENQKMTLALDAVDTAVEDILKTNPTEGILKEEDRELYQNTYSIRRFTDEPESLSVKIQAYATGAYETSASAWTLSNSENAYFATKSGNTFGITNARHLFNVRFTEKEQETKASGAADYKYEQKSDIDWGGENGIVGHGNVYTEMEKRSYNAENKTAFPTITSLAENNSYSGYKTIRNLYVADTEGPLGLFGINRGTINGLTMDGCVITGETASYVGAFCGVNAGKLTNLATTKTTSVTGGNYVGGIAGSDGYSYLTTDGIREAKNERTYGNLTNAATVTGKQVADAKASDSSSLSQPDADVTLASHFVGGIVGYIKGIYLSGGTEARGVMVDWWDNTGDVTSEYAGKDGKSFVGGLTGYAEHVDFEISFNVTGGNISGTGYNDGKGNTAAYVGGLVGYFTDGKITKCSISGSSVTVEWGNLGGIVGKNDVNGAVSSCETKMSKIISREYLNNTGCGGIIGFNASSKAISSNNNKAVIEKNEVSSMDVVSTGGIIGRQESKEPFLVEGCVNSGEVSAYTASAGIIGRIKGAGGKVSGCVNEASIYTKKENGQSREGAGGIVANIYGINAGQKLEISGCTNSGLIQGPYGGNSGIVASITGSGNNQFQQIIVRECINTGKCESTKDTVNNAGILAFTDVNREILIESCKNYGTGTETICGIAANVMSGTRLQKNFGAASCGIPIAPSGSTANVTEDNYYFSKLIAKKDTIVQTINYKDINISTQGKAAAVESANPKENLVDGSLETRCSYAIATPRTESTIMLVFQNPQKLETLDIYWYDQREGEANIKPREYTYTLSYLDNGNEKLEDAKPLFTVDGTEEGEPREFVGIGHKNTYFKYADTVDLTDNLAKKKVQGLVITVKGHTHTNKFVSLFEVAVNDDTDSGLVYEAEENFATKGTPLGVTENGIPYHAMNRAKAKVVRGMLMNPLDIKTGCGADDCKNAPANLGALKVEDGILTDAEVGKTAGNGKSLIASALDTINGWGDKLADLINPDTEKPKEDKEDSKEETETPETESPDDKKPIPEETNPPEGGGEPEDTEQEKEPVPEPEKQEPLQLTETIVADSDIPQTAVSWDEEDYVGAYDIVLQADKNEIYHYTLIKNPQDAEAPYLIMHETDKTDEKGDNIWEEMPIRKDDKYPRTEVLSSGTTVTTYYYPLGYSRTIDGIRMEEQEVTRWIPAKDENTQTGQQELQGQQGQQEQQGSVESQEPAEPKEPQMIEETTIETVEVPCQTVVEAYLECVVYTKTDGSVSRKLYLVFPDIETAEGVQKVYGTEQAYRYTYDMLITNQPADEQLYEAPAAMHWWRETDSSGNWITKVREAGKENE